MSALVAIKEDWTPADAMAAQRRHENFCSPGPSSGGYGFDQRKPTVRVVEKLAPLPLKMEEIVLFGEVHCRFQIFGGENWTEPRQLNLRDIERAVCLALQISKNDLMSPRREYPVVRRRQIAMYLSKLLTRNSLPAIGRHYGKDHTTVLHAIRKCEPLYELIKPKLFGPCPINEIARSADAAWDEVFGREAYATCTIRRQKQRDARLKSKMEALANNN